MEKKSFAAVFFRLYDRKIASGEITFSRTGINKTDFTNLCMDPSFVFREDDLRKICKNMGILFGPIAFILIPLGCVLSGAVHDYFAGMISIREGGAQMPTLIGRYLGKGVYQIYNAFLCILMLLVGAVFIYTPGDIFVTGVLGKQALVTSPALWITYTVIFVYYLIATLFPIDKIIGRIYPIFGAILLFSAIGIFFGLFFKHYQLTNVSGAVMT